MQSGILCRKFAKVKSPSTTRREYVGIYLNKGNPNGKFPLPRLMVIIYVVSNADPTELVTRFGLQGHVNINALSRRAAQTKF